MSRRTYWIPEEPRSIAYHELIDFCSIRASQCTFVLHNPKQVAKSCTQFLDELSEYTVRVVDQKEWPGTKLMQSVARVFWFRPAPEVVTILKSSVQGLYGWIFPNLPEDLAFYWPDGSPLLGTISHEQLAFLNLDDDEADAFRREAPRINLRSQREQSH
jgi:hypothetical protein